MGTRHRPPCRRRRLRHGGQHPTHHRDCPGLCRLLADWGDLGPVGPGLPADSGGGSWLARARWRHLQLLSRPATHSDFIAEASAHQGA